MYTYKTYTNTYSGNRRTVIYARKMSMLEILKNILGIDNNKMYSDSKYHYLRIDKQDAKNEELELDIPPYEYSDGPELRGVWVNCDGKELPYSVNTSVARDVIHDRKIKSKEQTQERFKNLYHNIVIEKRADDAPDDNNNSEQKENV